MKIIDALRLVCDAAEAHVSEMSYPANPMDLDRAAIATIRTQFGLVPEATTVSRPIAPEVVMRAPAFQAADLKGLPGLRAHLAHDKAHPAFTEPPTPPGPGKSYAPSILTLDDAPEVQLGMTKAQLRLLRLVLNDDVLTNCAEDMDLDEDDHQMLYTLTEKINATFPIGATNVPEEPPICTVCGGNCGQCG